MPEAGARADEGPVVTLLVVALLPGDSPRSEGSDPEHVVRLADVDGPLPPILVNRRTMQVVDGMHRLLAAVPQGRSTIEAELFEGTDEEAFLRAVAANVDHGLPLNRSDRRAAARRIIASHPDLSDREIARISGLSAKTVAVLRACPSGGQRQLNTRRGRDGRVSPLDASSGRRRAARLLAERPNALRDTGG